VSAKFGARPQWWRHWRLAMRLWFGCAQVSQWRLQGPNTWFVSLVRDIPPSVCLTVGF
jgi:hypothetical protein